METFRHLDPPDADFAGPVIVWVIGRLDMAIILFHITSADGFGDGIMVVSIPCLSALPHSFRSSSIPYSPLPTLLTLLENPQQAGTLAATGGSDSGLAKGPLPFPQYLHRRQRSPCQPSCCCFGIPPRGGCQWTQWARGVCPHRTGLQTVEIDDS